MPGLFDRSAENEGVKREEVREGFSALLRGSRYVSGSAEPHFLRQEAGRSAPTTVPRAPGRRPDPARLAALRREAMTLEAYLGEADEKLSALQGPYNALRNNFDAAHANLVMAWTGNDISPEARAYRKPLYDARMAAGVVWNPIKRDYQDTKSWRRAIVLSLMAINEELEK